jgi:hypothetical protein
MPTRKTLLLAMLWSLGFAAVAGVASVLFSLGDLVAKLVGTGLISASACGLLILLSAAAERERGRSAALAGMAAIVAEFVLAMLFIWEVPNVLCGWQLERELGLTMLNAGWFVVVLMIVLRVRVTQAGHIGGTVGVLLAPLAFVSCLIAVWINTHPFDDKLFETGGALLASGGLAMLALIGVGPPARRWWGWAGVTGAAGMLALWLWGIWISRGAAAGEVAFTICLTIAALAAHASLCVLCPLKVGQRWLLAGTIASGLATGALVDVYVINDLLAGRLAEGPLERLASAAGILTSCGSLALCVLARMNRRMGAAVDAHDLTELTAVCPRCQRKQTLRTGRNTCVVCGLRIEIRLEEPQCANCGYVLYGAVADRCPECGMAPRTDGLAGALSV